MSDYRQRRTMVVPIIRKANLSVETFRAYWKAVHGPVAARLPGVDFYEQLHLGTPMMQAGKPDPHYANECYDGLAILSFSSDDDFESYRAPGPIMPSDEANAFAFAARYDLIGEATGLVDYRANRSEPTDDETQYIALVYRREAVDHMAFEHEVSRYIEHKMASESIVAFDFIGARPETVPEPDSVDRFTPFGRQFQAIIRTANENPDEMALFARRICELPSVRATKIIPIVTSCLFVCRGMLSLEAIRGTEAARLIRELGAYNQEDSYILQLFMPSDKRALPMLTYQHRQC